MSRCLTDRSVDHVVLERAGVAESWRTGRWDSLRLLTPNWLNRLPGYEYRGDDPDGYMSMPEVVEYIRGYAGSIAAPIECPVNVTSVREAGTGFDVITSEGKWWTQTVVIATGPYHRADVPAFGAAVPADVECLTADQYHNPYQLAEGGVLVVGAAATGVQLAEEIHRSGRSVMLSVGSHVRMPRLYRGMDILWWLDAAGVLDERYDQVDDIVRARHVASFQLVGSDDRATVDLNSLQEIGVDIVGRLGGVTDDGTAQFSGSLPNQCALADLKLARLLDALDIWAADNGLDGEAGPPERFPATSVPAEPPLLLRLRSGQIKTIIWATGYRSEYPWLHVPVLDAKGRVVHDGGVTPVPGMYLIGAPFLRRRKSSFIDGAGDDARDLSDHLVGYLDQMASASS